jgi:hypothetical protein
MHAWKSENNGSTFQKNYPNPAGALNNNNANNNGTSDSNLPMIENSLKSFIQAQTEQNKILIKIRENHV